MVTEIFGDIRVVLGSQSPRRKELLARMAIDFQVVVKETDESYDPSLSSEDIVRHIALAKMDGFEGAEFDDALIITADTVVVFEDRVLGKPVDEDEAIATLLALQGRKHRVLTAVVLKYKGQKHCFVEETVVQFFPLTEEEVSFYVRQYLPLDKAGSYGIQEWIGLIGIQSISGSYENVVGLPTARLYQEMKQLYAAGKETERE